MATNPIDMLVNQVLEMLPQSASVMQQDVHQTLKTTLTAALKKMDLVTRDEFDAQKAVLETTRAKLKLLEQQLASLMQNKAN